jgi:hypothetical protein
VVDDERGHAMPALQLTQVSQQRSDLSVEVRTLPPQPIRVYCPNAWSSRSPGIARNQ